MVLVIFSDIIHPSTLSTSLLHSLLSGFCSWLALVTIGNWRASSRLAVEGSDTFLIETKMEKAWHFMQTKMKNVLVWCGALWQICCPTTAHANCCCFCIKPIYPASLQSELCDRLNTQIWTGETFPVLCNCTSSALTHLWLLDFGSKLLACNTSPVHIHSCLKLQSSFNLCIHHLPVDASVSVHNNMFTRAIILKRCYSCVWTQRMYINACLWAPFPPCFHTPGKEKEVSGERGKNTIFLFPSMLLRSMHS